MLHGPWHEQQEGVVHVAPQLPDDKAGPHEDGKEPEDLPHVEVPSHRACGILRDIVNFGFVKTPALALANPFRQVALIVLITPRLAALSVHVDSGHRWITVALEPVLEEVVRHVRIVKVAKGKLALVIVHCYELEHDEAKHHLHADGDHHKQHRREDLQWTPPHAGQHNVRPHGLLKLDVYPGVGFVLCTPAILLRAEVVDFEGLLELDAVAHSVPDRWDA
mmetsp:Transcript_77805/g.175921  ORF Transcript_77805/g.175921 Transcript_77805/m.175921 type:complete len:221 (+) Transcript_77805:700-1362(+)